MMLGAYSVFLFNGVFGLPFSEAVVLGVPLAILIGVSTAWLAFDLLGVRGPAFLLIVSVEVSLVLRHLAQLAFGPDFQEYSIPLQRPHIWGPVRLTTNQIATLAIAVLPALGAHLALNRTRFGRALRAMCDNPALCEIAGMNVDRVKLGLWLVSVTLAAIAGVLFGLNFIIEPDMGWNLLIPIFSATILGGIGNPCGCAVWCLDYWHRPGMGDTHHRPRL
jgi:branched-chain amino acid transport system permease protein